VVSIEQVQLLENKIANLIEHVRRVNAQNAALASERAGLQAKLDTYQKRIDELEVHVLRFKEDQGRIEDGIIAALDRLSQFEEAFEKSLSDGKPAEKKPAIKREKTEAETGAAKPSLQKTAAAKSGGASGNSKEFFEIAKAEDDADDLISGKFESSSDEASSDVQDGELDIF